jgi:hypothetical protein
MMTGHAQCLSAARSPPLAQQPVGRTQSQRGACQRGYLCRARVGVEDHELAGECDHRDQDHRLNLDDAVPTQRHAHDGMLDPSRSNHDHAEHALEYLVVQGLKASRTSGVKTMEMSWNSDTMMMTAITADSTSDDLLEALVKTHDGQLVTQDLKWVKAF